MTHHEQETQSFPLFVEVETLSASSAGWMRNTTPVLPGRRPTEELWALAGHFVGEGCARMTPTGSPEIKVEVNDARELFLYPRLFGTPIKTRERERRTYYWRVYGDRAKTFVLAMLPYLWGTKARQCELLVLAWRLPKGEERDRVVEELSKHKRTIG